MYKHLDFLIFLKVTGAADGMLKVWKAGSCKATVKAHSQAIRGKNSEQLVFQANDSFQECLPFRNFSNQKILQFIPSCYEKPLNTTI